MDIKKKIFSYMTACIYNCWSTLTVSVIYVGVPVMSKSENLQSVSLAVKPVWQVQDIHREPKKTRLESMIRE